MVGPPLRRSERCFRVPLPHAIAAPDTAARRGLPGEVSITTPILVSITTLAAAADAGARGIFPGALTLTLAAAAEPLATTTLTSAAGGLLRRLGLLRQPSWRDSRCR